MKILIVFALIIPLSVWAQGHPDSTDSIKPFIRFLYSITNYDAALFDEYWKTGKQVNLSAVRADWDGHSFPFGTGKISGAYIGVCQHSYAFGPH